MGKQPGWVDYFFWLTPLVALVGVSWVNPTGGVQIFYLPVGLALLYGVVVSRVHSTRVGPLAWWISLVGFLLVGPHCWGPTRFGWTDGTLLADPVGTPYVFLTVSLLPLIVLASLDSLRGNPRVYYFWVLFLGGVLVLCFTVTNFLAFYTLFEILGFPMFLLIGQYGPRPQRVGAAYKFFVYTFGGSAFILPVLVYFQFWLGSSDLFFLQAYQFTPYEEALFVGLACVPFGVKIPLVPVHLWLPEAHVEAPTPISMLLAGLLLKTGGYAFLRFLIPVFPGGFYLWGPLLTSVGLFSVVVASVYALVQVDMKRMIAYASVAHMSVVFVGLVSGVPGGAVGATYLMLAHGYTSAGLFGGIGVLYDRYHTRTVRYYGGLAGVMPLGGIFFFLLTLGNLSFPFTGGFTGEFQILAALALQNVVVCLVTGVTVFLSLGYSVWLFNRLFYGSPGWLTRHGELTPVEFGVLGATAGATLGLGWGGSSFVGFTQVSYASLYEGLTG